VNWEAPEFWIDGDCRGNQAHGKREVLFWLGLVGCAIVVYWPAVAKPGGTLP
jgi:hypothetical protein